MNVELLDKTFICLICKFFQSIKTVTMVKYLGAEIDNTLSGKLIAENVVKKTGNQLKFLWRHSKCLKTNIV